MELSELKLKLAATLEHFRVELAQIRTGRASVALVEDLKIEAYEGSPPLTLRELATLSAPEPHLIVVQPWDPRIVPKIEEAIRDASNLGVSPVVFDNLIRIPIPPLSLERREEFVKIVGSKAEEAKIVVRQIRQNVMKEIERLEEEKEIGEDEKFRRKKLVEEEVRKINEKIEELKREKEKELLSI